MDQLMTWREIGFNMCSREPDYDRYESLPSWAQKTLSDHAGDVRPQIYDLEQFESASTHDELWNAAQRQLVRDGRIQRAVDVFAENLQRWQRGGQLLHEITESDLPAQPETWVSEKR